MADNATALNPARALPVPGAGMPSALLAGWSALPPRNKLATMVGSAASIAILAAAWMWSQAPDYKILFTHIPDKDGGAIIAALNQQNVPYRIADGGGAIMVPAPLVHETRLKLASQGLPKGGTSGFELIDNQKFGATQFQEQVNYQRALEGELSKSIQSLGAVQSARVHLAIPRPSIFMREQQKPTASVLVSLYPGKSLERAQIAGITHLVSSSLPDLPVKNVSVVDQSGALLSQQADQAAGQLDPTQLSYVQQVEQAHIKRVMEILTPLYGAENVRAQVTADIDFNQSESTSENFKPNQNKEGATVRSQQLSESSNGAGSAAGVPGALSNTPPGAASAPIAGGAPTNPGAAAGGPATASAQSRRDSVINYEIDKTIRHVKSSTGAIKRLSAAVVINNRKVQDVKAADGKAAEPKGADAKAAKAAAGGLPLTAAELTQINALVKEAIGFSTERGDSLNVVNAAFTQPALEILPEPPLWKQPDSIAMAKDLGKQALIGLVVLYLLLGVLRPMLKQVLAHRPPEPPAASPDGPQSARNSGGTPVPALPNALDSARTFAKQDPKIVANVVRNWVNGNE